MRLGKFFTLSPAGVAGSIVEVAGGSQEAGTELVTGRPTGQADALAEHQLWWEDRPNHSIRSKSNNLCITTNKDGKITLQPYQSLNRNQRWRRDGMQIKSRDNEKLIGLDEQETHPGGHLYSQDVEDAYGEEWLCKHSSPHFMHVEHTASGKVLDVAWESDKAGAELIVYNLWPQMKDNQLWYEDQDGVIRSKMNDFALTFAEGGSMSIHPYKDKQKNQQWVVSQNAIVNVPDPNYVLDISRPKLAFLKNIKGSFQVIAVEYNGSAEQRWEFLYADHCEATFGPTSRYVHLRHETTGLLMTSLPLKTIGIPSDRIDVILDDSRGDTCKEQQWLVDEGEKRITSAVDGRSLDLSGEEAVIQTVERHSRTQSWSLVSMTIQNGVDQDLYLGTSSGVLSPDSTGFNRVVARKANTANGPDLWKATKARATFFYIRTKAGDQVLDVKGDVKDSGGDVIIYERKAGPPADNQLWYEDEDGLLRSKLNSYVCDSSDKSIKMRPYRRGATDQQWVIFGDVIKNRSKPDLCFDISRNRVKNGTAIIPYKFNNQANQKWIFEYV